MTRLLMGFLALGLAVLAVGAADHPAPKPAPSDVSFDALKKDYEDALRKFNEQRRKEEFEQILAAAEKDVRDAKTDEEKRAAQKQLRELRQLPALGGSWPRPATKDRENTPPYPSPVVPQPSELPLPTLRAQLPRGRAAGATPEERPTGGRRPLRSNPEGRLKGLDDLSR